jgi:hypothetical protein
MKFENVRLSELDKLLVVASENEINFDCFEGCLLDNFIFYNTENLKINNVSAKYIIVKENYLNEYSSDLIIIMTNSDEEIENTIKGWSN